MLGQNKRTITFLFLQYDRIYLLRFAFAQVFFLASFGKKDGEAMAIKNLAIIFFCAVDKDFQDGLSTSLHTIFAIFLK